MPTMQAQNPCVSLRRCAPRLLMEYFLRQGTLTGKERDTESGNDYFGARYYASTMGRFLSADDGEDQDSEDPQSWNLYSYVRNNPLINTDPDGHDCVIQTRTDENHETVTSQSGNCDGVKLQSGQSATYVNGTVTGWQASADHKSLEIGFNSYDGQSSGVQSAAGAPAFNNPGIDGPANAAVFGRIGNQGMGAIGVFAAGSVIGGTVGGVALSAAGTEAGLSILTEDLEGVLSRAASSVGNQGAKVASREVAEEAAKKWVGEGARPIVDRATGKVVGEISADGTKVARFTSAETKGYINLVDRITGGNLHVRW